MKFVFLILMAPSIACAQWISKADFEALKLDSEADHTSYPRSKAQCERRETPPCFKSKNPKRWMVGLVDDTDRAIWAKRDVESCSDRATCQPLLEAKDCSAYVDGWAVMLDDFSEVYCAERTGYEQKEDLVPDAAGRAAHDAEKAARQAERDLRKTKRQERRAAMRTCITAVNAGGNLSNADAKNCVELLVKEVFDEEIDAADL